MENVYHLIPRGDGGRFDEVALAQMRAYWEGKPFYVRSDGAYMICLNEGTREAVLKNRGPDEPNYVSHVIRFQAEHVILASLGWPELDAQFADFIEWCQQRWPCELLRSTGEPVGVSELRHD